MSLTSDMPKNEAACHAKKERGVRAPLRADDEISRGGRHPLASTIMHINPQPATHGRLAIQTVVPARSAKLNMLR